MADFLAAMLEEQLLVLAALAALFFKLDGRLNVLNAKLDGLSKDHDRLREEMKGLK